MNVKKLEIRNVEVQDETVNFRLYDPFGGFLDLIFGWEALEDLYDNIRSFLDNVNEQILDKLEIEGDDKEKIDGFGKDVLEKIKVNNLPHLPQIEININQ